MVDTSRLPTPVRVLVSTQFGLFYAGNGLSLIGTWMQRIACGWLVWEWTQSAFWLGVLAAGDLLPVVVIGPFAGVAADRWDRLRQNILGQGVSAMLAVVFALLLATGEIGLAGVILLTTLQGTLSALIQPARLAMIRQMVRREDMGTAVALNSVNVNLARLLGPAIAGLMIARYDILWVFVANAVVTLILTLILARLCLEPREAAPSGSFLGEMTEGFRHVAATPALRLILVAMLLGGSTARSMIELMPAIAATTFPRGATGLAVLTGSAAVGAVVSGLTIGRLQVRRLFHVVMLWWVLGAGAAVLLTRTEAPATAMIAATVLGAATTRGLVLTQTFVQITTPSRLQGRVLSLHGLIQRGSPALGALIIGFLADRIGLATATMIASTTLVVSFLLLAPFIRNAATGIRETD